MDTVKAHPEKLQLGLLTATFPFDVSRVHFEPDIPVDSRAMNTCLCVPIAYIATRSTWKKTRYTIHGIVARQRQHVDDGLERVGYFSVSTNGDPYLNFSYADSTLVIT